MFKKLIVIFLFIGFIIGLDIYRREFTGLGSQPERSAFSGRLPFTEAGDFRRFQFFYTTNRENNEESFTRRGNQLGDQLTSGTFDALIRPGLLIRPLEWFESHNIRLDQRTHLAEESYFESLKRAVQKSPEKSLLVIIWGFRDWFESAALKTAYTGYVLDINTPVVLFDWPGNQGEGTRAYFASREAAKRSAMDLAKWLKTVQDKTHAEKIWVIGSSLGCQVITDALVSLNDSPLPYKLDHVVLSAPDIAYDSFSEKLQKTIPHTAERLSAYVSSNDRALLMSAWLNGRRKLGRIDVSIPPEEREAAYQYEQAEKLMEFGLKEVRVIDATPINITRNLHHFFTDSPEYFDDLYQRLLAPQNIVSRRLHPIRQSNGREYWILWSY